MTTHDPWRQPAEALPASPMNWMAATLALLVSLNANAQGVFQWTVTFDGSPPIQPSDEIGMYNYSEAQMRFTPIGSGQFGRSGGQASAAFPRNGTAYLFAGLGHTLAVTSLRDSRFGFIAVDLAEWSTLYPTPLVVKFVGYKPDGTTVTTELVTDGIIDGAGPVKDFQTFYLDSRFADVTRVEMPGYGWSLDNMVFSNVIPEPRTGALLVFGAVLVGCGCFRRTRRGP